jgi:hypothetical protein
MEETMRKNTLKILAALSIILISACAAIPDNRFVHTGPNHDALLPNVRKVAVIADVCLLRNVVAGDKYWSVKDSRAAAQHMAESAKTVLKAKGYEVVLAEAPLVGSFKNPGRPLRYMPEEGGDVREMPPPLFVAEGLASDPARRASLLKIMPWAAAAVAQRDKPPSDICCTHGDLKEAAANIAKASGADAILLLMGHGINMPLGSPIAQEATTELVKFVLSLSLGMVSSSDYRVSVLDSYTALVDASTGEILWSNYSQRQNDVFTEKEFYDRIWLFNNLYLLPSKNVSKEKERR